MVFRGIKEASQITLGKNLMPAMALFGILCLSLHATYCYVYISANSHGIDLKLHEGAQEYQTINLDTLG